LYLDKLQSTQHAILCESKSVNEILLYLLRSNIYYNSERGFPSASLHEGPS